MKKTTLILLLFVTLFTSCEKDDFCTKNPITPQLILRFYDDENKDALKKPTDLYVWANGKDTIFNKVSLDSISLPLNSLSNQTVYNFSVGNVVNQFTIAYTPKEDYISRSCGFRVVFNEVTFSSNNTWITDFTPTTLTSINHQNTAHVKIYH